MNMKNKNNFSTNNSLSNTLSFERKNEAKEKVKEAILNNKVFMIQGPYSSVRNCLRSRGWVEKFYHFSHHNKPILKTEKSEENEDLDYNDGIPPWNESDGFYAYMNRLLLQKEPDLIWSIKKDSLNQEKIYKNQILNHFSNSIFTTKVGLNSYLQDSYWHEENYCHSFYPRVYQLVKLEEKLAFEMDFIQTACVSLLKIISCNSADTSNILGNLPEIIIPDNIFKLALNTCACQISFLTHNDLDCDFATSIIVPQNFQDLLYFYYSVRGYNGRVSIKDLPLRTNQIVNVLSQLSHLCPQYHMDGCRNVWILKPGAMSRGRGVICLDSLESILEVVQSQVLSENKYVLQKYIEQPLLVYETKFDIRQWFLVTDWNPLTVWMYKQYYLRFCSINFSLDDLEASRHLTNNSIQKNYNLQEGRSQNLPDHNMWTSQQFQQYLIQKGDRDGEWREKIYESMKEAILSAMRCCQHEVQHRKNSFELYGADFMLDEERKVWLIEINSSPCMTSSTPVTSHMCPSVIQDTFKVVLDYKRDKNADTGEFELVYRQDAVLINNSVGLRMQVTGQSISNNHSNTRCRSGKNKSSCPKCIPNSSKICKDDDVANVLEDKVGKKIESLNEHSIIFKETKSNCNGIGSQENDAEDNKQKLKKRKNMKKKLEKIKQVIKDKKLVKNPANISDQDLVLKTNKNIIINKIFQMNNIKQNDLKIDGSVFELEEQTNLQTSGRNKLRNKKASKERLKVLPGVLTNVAYRESNNRFTSKLENNMTLKKVVICKNISLYIHKFENTQKECASSMKLCTPQVSNNIPHPDTTLNGNWTVYKRTFNEECQHYSHQPPPLPFKKFNQGCINSHTLRKSPVETCSLPTLIRLTLKGKQILKS